MRDHDLAKMTATLEMAVGVFRVRKPECPVDRWVQAMHRDRAVHGFEVGRLPTLIDPSVIPRPVNNNGSSPFPMA